jgi:hypothetical protein
MTLAQELAWERWKACDRFPTISLKEIRTDGQIIVWTHHGTDLAAWRACDTEARQQQATRRTASSGGPAPVVSGAPAATPLPLKPGSEWAYRWETTGGKGTFVFVLDREESRDGSTWYVVKSGTRELFWRTKDLALSVDAVNGEVETKRSPPMEMFRFPLAVGTQWEQTYTLERPKERQTEEIQTSCKIESEEVVVVPAGSFRAFKSVCSNKRTGRMLVTLWYSPEVRSFVREISLMRNGTTRERELIQYRLR